MTHYLRFRDLVERRRFGNRMTLARHIEAGLFPKPVRLGPNTLGWDDAEIAVYDDALKAARDAGITAHVDLADFVRRYVAEHADRVAA